MRAARVGRLVVGAAVTHPRWILRVLALRLRGVRCSFDGVRVDAASRVAPGALLAAGVNLIDTRVERFSALGRSAKCQLADVGPFCSIASDATLGATAHPLDRATTHAFPYRRAAGGLGEDVPLPRPRTRLGPDVWVGAHAIVLPGVAIGAGAVLGAGSVITRDVAPYSIVAGSPARELRRRVPDDWASRLQKLAWWDWPIETLRRNLDLFRAPLSAEVLEALEAIADARR